MGHPEKPTGSTHSSTRGLSLHEQLERQAEIHSSTSSRGRGASQGFPRAATPMGVFSRGTTRISGSLSCGAREVKSPPFLTRVAEYLPSTDKRVTPRLPWRNGSPRAFRVVHGVTGLLLSCVWNLWVFPDDTEGCQCPFVLCLHPLAFWKNLQIPHTV